jgi:acyl-CoA hydrolase
MGTPLTHEAGQTQSGRPLTPAASFTETVQVALPNDANPMGFVLGGKVMHLIDIAGAIAAHRHARVEMVTAAVDQLQFLHPIQVGDLMILRARVTATFNTSLEVEVEVLAETILTGDRRRTSLAYLTFVTMPQVGRRVTVPPLTLVTADDRRRSAEAHGRREARLRNKPSEQKG